MSYLVLPHNLVYKFFIKLYQSLHLGSEIREPWDLQNVFIVFHIPMFIELIYTTIYQFLDDKLLDLKSCFTRPFVPVAIPQSQFQLPLLQPPTKFLPTFQIQLAKYRE